MKYKLAQKDIAILGYTYLLKKKYADQSDIVEGLGKMERTVADSVRIFEFAKIYEQLGVEMLTFVNVETTFNDALAFFSSLTFKVANNCQGLTVLADSFVTKLFYNLIETQENTAQKPPL